MNIKNFRPLKNFITMIKILECFSPLIEEETDWLDVRKWRQMMCWWAPWQPMMFPLFIVCSHLENQDKWNTGLYRQQSVQARSVQEGQCWRLEVTSVRIRSWQSPHLKDHSAKKCFILNWPWPDAGTIHICPGTSDEHKILSWRLQMIF